MREWNCSSCHLGIGMFWFTSGSNIRKRNLTSLNWHDINRYNLRKLEKLQLLLNLLSFSQWAVDKVLTGLEGAFWCFSEFLSRVNWKSWIQPCCCLVTECLAAEPGSLFLVSVKLHLSLLQHELRSCVLMLSHLHYILCTHRPVSLYIYCSSNIIIHLPPHFIFSILLFTFILRVPPCLPLPAFVAIYSDLTFSEKWIWVEAALLPVQREDSHGRPSIVHLINQPPLQHGTAKTCICSKGASSNSSPIVINRAGKKGCVACTGYCAIHLTELNSWQHRVQPQQEQTEGHQSHGNTFIDFRRLSQVA